ELMILVTSEGSLSGDIDTRLINQFTQNFRKEHNDVIVIGHHGAVMLAQRNIPYIKSYKLPERDHNFNVMPLIKFVKKYSSTTVFYETYVSLMTQDIKQIQLSAAVA